ncbi:MAG: hypothetical protein ORN49_11840, partial [Rhodobacteraceae bacterium]|nr:hypothetical protein [Paracoccaceae bacterium]
MQSLRASERPVSHYRNGRLRGETPEKAKGWSWPWAARREDPAGRTEPVMRDPAPEQTYHLPEAEALFFQQDRVPQELVDQTWAEPDPDHWSQPQAQELARAERIWPDQPRPAAQSL